MPEGESERPLIAVTMGDPAGIGPELCLRIMREPTVLSECVPLIFGDAGVLRRVARECGLPGPDREIPISGWLERKAARAPAVIDCRTLDVSSVQPGKVQANCGRASFEYIRLAVKYAMAGEVAAIATAPVNKEALHAAEVPYPGHTEILAALTKSPRVCMMLTSDQLTVSMATTHVGFAEVSRRLSAERIRDVIELTNEAMRRLAKPHPRLGVCGLNPHAGEHGLFGHREEEELIEPAIAAARSKGINVDGPIPPDTAFTANRRREYDAIVCMYHDQGHIPFKMLAFDTGVNITLGLPIIRVSVDHGTAFDIAWMGRADPTSMIQAVLCAARLAGGGLSE